MPDTEQKEPTFTLAEVLVFLEKASELTGKNIHGVLDKIDPRLVTPAELANAAKPDRQGRPTKAIPMLPFVPPAPTVEETPKG
jgi:hypothetical protein